MAIISGKGVRVFIDGDELPSEAYELSSLPWGDEIDRTRPAFTAALKFEPVARPRLFINHELWLGIQKLLDQVEVRGDAWFRQALCDLLPFNLGPQLIQYSPVHVIVGDEFTDPLLDVPEPVAGTFGRLSAGEEE